MSLRRDRLEVRIPPIDNILCQIFVIKWLIPQSMFISRCFDVIKIFRIFRAPIKAASLALMPSICPREGLAYLSSSLLHASRDVLQAVTYIWVSSDIEAIIAPKNCLSCRTQNSLAGFGILSSFEKERLDGEIFPSTYPYRPKPL